jgi:hypothetical protein
VNSWRRNAGQAQTLRIVKQVAVPTICARLRKRWDCSTAAESQEMQMEPAENQRRLSLLLVDDDVELCGMRQEFFAEAIGWIAFTTAGTA